MLCLAYYERKQDEERHRPCDKCGARLMPQQLKFYKDRYLCNWCYQDALADAARHECAFCRKWIAEPEKAFLDACYLASLKRYTFDMTSIDRGKLDRGKIKRMANSFPERTKMFLIKYGYIKKA